MRALVVLEHEAGTVLGSSLAALGFARSVASGPVTCLVLGSEIEAAARDAARYAPTLAADHPALAAPVAGPLARVVADVARAERVDLVVAGATSWAKDVVGRAAGELGGALASDVVGHELSGGELILHRPMFAGSVLARVRLQGAPRIVTVREAAHAAAAPAPAACDVTSVTVDADGLPEGARVHGLTLPGGGRPALGAARVVVSGGGAFKSRADYEALVGGLADALGGAAGCSRAAVDTGAAPGDLQIGQTGKVVAPELYVALGLSGAVQHLAGMRGSGCVVAVNTDPDAPILEVADFALIADVFDVVPRLIADLRRPEEGLA